MSVLLANEVEISKIQVTAPKTLDSGGKLMFINHNSEILYIQSPEFEVPFDCTWSEYNPNNLPIRVSFKDKEENTEINAFYNLMDNLDNHLKEQARKNSSQWLKKPKASKDVIESLYTPLIKQSLDKDTGEPDGKYPDSFAFKVQKKNDIVNCKVYDSQRNDLLSDPDNNLQDVLKKGSKVKAILKCAEFGSQMESLVAIGKQNNLW